MLVNKGLLGKQAFYDFPWFWGSERADLIFLTNATFEDYDSSKGKTDWNNPLIFFSVL